MEKERPQERIATLEANYVNLDEKVDLIMTNHLPHIQDKVDRVHDKVTFWGGAIAVLTIIVPLAINYLTQ